MSPERADGATDPYREVTQAIQLAGSLLIGIMAIVSIQLHTRFWRSYLSPDFQAHLNVLSPIDVTAEVLGAYTGGAMALIPVVIVLISKHELISDIWL